MEPSNENISKNISNETKSIKMQIIQINTYDFKKTDFLLERKLFWIWFCSIALKKMTVIRNIQALTIQKSKKANLKFPIIP